MRSAWGADLGRLDGHEQRGERGRGARVRGAILPDVAGAPAHPNLQARLAALPGLWVAGEVLDVVGQLPAE